MAAIVGGLACSHGPLLSVPPDLWHLRAGADRAGSHWFQGRRLDYASLLAARAPGFAARIVPESQQQAYARCQVALDRMAEAFSGMAADAVVIIGNDQRELFQEDFTPGLLVCTAAQIENVPLPDEQRARLPPGIAESEHGHCPPGGAVYPGLPDAAGALADELCGRGFDVATSARLPRGQGRREGVPHAFGFVYRRILRDRPPPSIPLFVNVGTVPNQIRVPRALALGQALAASIAALPGTARVVVVASGGLSHFVVDEDFDHRVLQALAPFDAATLQSLPESWLQGNSAEIKSWLVLAAAMHEAGLPLARCDYHPCYRTEAGTGSGMGFATWLPA